MIMKKFEKIKNAYEAIVERSSIIKKDFIKNSITKKEVFLNVIKNTKFDDILHNIISQFFFGLLITFLIGGIQYLWLNNISFLTSAIVLFLSCLTSFTIFTSKLYSKQKKKILMKCFVSQKDINYLLDFYDEIDKKNEHNGQRAVADFKKKLETHIKEQKGYVTFGFYCETLHNCKMIFENIKSRELENNAKEIADTIVCDFYKDKKNIEVVELKKETETV